ncbi:MAG: AAA family ATPase [Chloroflexota bacterium]|nr:AAA family ATPase [Chloroflexota bacterium]
MTTADKVLKALEAYNLTQEGDNRYRCNSPLRAGSDSESFSVIIDGAEHGAYKDHVSGDSGSLYQLAEKLGIAIERQQVATSKRAYQGIADYARAHGMDPKELAAAGWNQTTKDNRPAIEFPTRTGKRWRFLDGNKPYFKSESGYKKCWYGLDRIAGDVGGDVPLVICNGEISVLAAQSYKIAAACVTAGEGKIPDDLMADLDRKLWLPPAQIKVIIALDCDEKGHKAARQIEAQFRSAGYQALAVDLGLTDKGDLADLCMLYQNESLAHLLTLPPLPQDAPAPAPELDEEDDDPLTLIDISEFGNLPPVRWIVPGEIPEKGFVTIFGESNVGKSFIALDYALNIATEQSVVYVACEGESGIPIRVYAWCQHHHRAPEALKFKMLVGYVSLFERDERKRFVTTLRDAAPYLIVVDTFGLVMGSGDENSAGDVNMVMKGCRAIQRALGCTIIFVHHTNKEGNKERGSGALRGRMDTMIQVLPDDDLVRVESSKTRDQEPFPPKSIKLLPVEVEGKGSSLVPIPADQVIRSNDLTPDQRKLLEVMALSIHVGGVSQRDLSELGRLPYGRVVRALSNLVNKGYIEKPTSRHEHHRITNDGRRAIGADPVDDDDSVDRSPGLVDRFQSSVDRSKNAKSSRVDRLDRVDRTFFDDSSEEEGDPDSQYTPDPADPTDPHGKKHRSTETRNRSTKPDSAAKAGDPPIQPLFPLPMDGPRKSQYDYNS